MSRNEQKGVRNGKKEQNEQEGKREVDVETWRSEVGSLLAQMTTGKSIGLPLRPAGQQDT